MMKASLLLFSIFFFSIAYGQFDDDVFSRLQAISNNGIDFFNVDGLEITSKRTNASFAPKNISKEFKQFKIKKKELIQGDSLLGFQNYYVFKTQEEPKGYHNNISYYFVKDSNNQVVGFTFASINKTDKEFERKFISSVMNNQIPNFVYNDLQADTIDFAGRKIPLGANCNWMGVNNIQCRYYGQMNWSVHQNLEDARETVNNQFASMKSRKNGEVVADTTVNILFEGIETKAKKVIYDFTGVTSALVGMSGGKTLTIYYVASPVRDNYVSCVMSFWNNDQINPSGLPPLLEQVMKLE
jgi:hypothetical protein